jgi:hypothetical protein
MVATRGVHGDETGVPCKPGLQEQVVYILAAQSILGSLALVPVCENGAITSSLSANLSAFKRGKCENWAGLEQGASSSTSRPTCGL